jgi:predicted DNA-binding transcriptional regulator AlpA
MKEDNLLFYRFSDLKTHFKISRTSVARWERLGLFPKRIKFGERCIGWRCEDIDNWIKEKIKNLENQKNEI